MNRKLNILSFGEVLWDIFPSGKTFGGAPANFAFHCAQLGAYAKLVSRVGRDRLGEELLRHCDNLKLDREFVACNDRLPTGTVTVELQQDGQPRYTIEQGVAWDEIDVPQRVLDAARSADAVCFGSLAARTKHNRDALETLREATDVNASANPDALNVLDLNLRDPFCEKETIAFVLARANVLKLNDEELRRLDTMFRMPQSESIEERMRCWIARNRLRLMIVTCGRRGAYLATPEESVFTPGREVEVVDTVGAGDAFTACVVVRFLEKKPLRIIAENATDLAAFVCTARGGTPGVPEQFR